MCLGSPVGLVEFSGFLMSWLGFGRAVLIFNFSISN